MRSGQWLVVALVAVAGTAPARAVTPNAGPSARAIDPKADAVMKRMSGYLSGLKSFTFHTQSFEEAVTTEGQKVDFPAAQRVAVERPNKLRSDRIDRDSDTVFRYDGSKFSLYGKRTGYYAVAPAPGRLDEAIDAAKAHFNIDAPASDLLASDPYAALMSDVDSGRYIGLETVDGVPCHHLAFRNADVDWQLWVQDGPRPLPRRYVITSKKVAGEPSFTLNISDWKPQASLSEGLFAFQPPPGAKQVDLQPAPPVPLD